MNFKKPVIRIKLERQAVITPTAIRKMGPDCWLVEAFQSTTEGQKNEQSFRSTHKEVALNKAYEYLRLTQKYGIFDYKLARDKQEEEWREELKCKTSESIGYTPEMDALPDSFYASSKRWWQFWK